MVGESNKETSKVSAQLLTIYFGNDFADSW